MDNLSTLEELCLDAIAENITSFIERKENDILRREYTFDNREHFTHYKHSFKDENLYLIPQVSERLLRKMLEKKKLTDSTLHIFSNKNTKLRSFRIKNCDISAYGLQILREHKLVELECVDLKEVSVGNILDCLNDWTLENLLSVNFAHTTCIDSVRQNYLIKILNLQNVRCLNLSYTELNQHCFTKICEEMKLLMNFNISGTNVQDLKPLLILKEQLKILGVADLQKAKSFAEVIIQLDNLQQLDLSLVQQKVDTDLMEPDCPIIEILEKVSCLPHLKSLDVSGWKGAFSSELLAEFVENKEKLEYLGIVLNDATFDANFYDLNYSTLPKSLVIGGVGNEQQIKVALVKYRERQMYMQKTLYHLFQITNTQEPKAEFLPLILPVMAAHSKKFGVQMAATACLYNLTKAELSKKVHPTILAKGVNLTLDAMRNFPAEFQLQKNALLTLCNDRVLQEINFNRFNCARLVLDALCNFDDPNINRMAVAISSILAAKISTEETSTLGSQKIYMTKLLSIVQNRVTSAQSDITLKFTLNALWNLTDESPDTCKVFLEQNGALLFLDVLEVFANDNTTETKVLGLLNNIAEVISLRKALLSNKLILALQCLLKSENIDVSYFAAGIIAHLSSTSDIWNTSDILVERSLMLELLEKVILDWNLPESEMVAYRSFKPFFPLLNVDMDYQVQLWAIWAIHHVCTKNPKRYCPMLREENGEILLKNIVQYSRTNPHIRTLSVQILETLKENT